MEQSHIFDKFSLDGRTAVVTGGQGLLGAEFCRTLAQAGAHVVIADLNLQAADSLAEQLTNQDLSATAVHLDVTHQQSVQNMVSSTLDLHGRLDILVNSAALDPKFDPQHKSDSSSPTGSHNFSYSFEEYPLDTWKAAIDVNLTGVYLCCQYAVKPMLQQERGVIINLASFYGLTAPDQRIYAHPDMPPQYKPAYYPTSKAGILGFTRYLAAYFAGKNIRVNALSPGGVYNKHDPNFVGKYSSRTMLGRMANKDEMNGALLFLASDASSYMTGANLIVDGGWTAW